MARARLPAKVTQRLLAGIYAGTAFRRWSATWV
jgi:hypothetical protein